MADLSLPDDGYSNTQAVQLRIITFILVMAMAPMSAVPAATVSKGVHTDE
ncbi:MAG: hypothetical protein ACM3SP_22480 [Chloroflexota bacterium]